MGLLLRLPMLVVDWDDVMLVDADLVGGMADTVEIYRGSLTVLLSICSFVKSLRVGAGELPLMRAREEGGDAASDVSDDAVGGGLPVALYGGMTVVAVDGDGWTCRDKDWITLYKLPLVSCAASLMCRLTKSAFSLMAV
jgi:hypothetical protein